MQTIVEKELDTKYNADFVQHRLLEVLAYFDVFNHPLTKTEIIRIIGEEQNILTEVLIKLTGKKIIFEHNDFFSMDACIGQLVEKRIKAEQRAKTYMLKLEKYTKLISSFPFVKGIAVSGSLSKGIMHENGDIDFFIITAPNRLWICRTLLIAFKKVRLLNSRKYFCLNYFVDTNNLEIPDKNIFTFMELFFLLPVYSENNTLEDFFASNAWMKNYFPSFEIPVLPDNSMVTKQKSISENLLAGKLGSFFEELAHKATVNRWRKKFAHFQTEKFELTMRSTKGVSKHHPRDFQSRVLTVYEDKLNQLTSR